MNCKWGYCFYGRLLALFVLMLGVVTYAAGTPATISLKLVDSSGLSSVLDKDGKPRYSIYMIGYCQVGKLPSDSSVTTAAQYLIASSTAGLGKFQEIPLTSSAGGSADWVKFGTGPGEVNTITLDPTNNKLNGARLYFFIYDSTKTYTYSGSIDTNTGLPCFPWAGNGSNFSVNVPNPPQSDWPIYNYAEFTYVAKGGLVIDASAVDGLLFPLNIKADVDTLTLGGVGIGQPVTDPSTSDFCRDSIITAYQTFITDSGDVAKPFADLYIKSDGSLLNPGAYLQSSQSARSDLNTYFDSALKDMFNSDISTKGISLISDQTAGASPTNYYYTVAYNSSVNVPMPSSYGTPPRPQAPPSTLNYGSSTANPTVLTHDALALTGYTSGGVAAPAGYDSYNVFNPVGYCVTNYIAKDTNLPTPITGTILDDYNATTNPNASTSTLTFTTPLPADTPITVGMFVGNGAGVQAGTYVKSINYSKPGDSTTTIESVTLDWIGPGNPTPKSTYTFSKNINYAYSSGSMVFANNGVFADSGSLDASSDFAVILKGLQRDIVSAFNRGVALKYGTGTNYDGHTSIYWGNENNWYPDPSATDNTTTQNLFSYFMHTAEVGTTPVFTTAINNTTCARTGTPVTMNMSYGFAYDETPGHGPYVPSSTAPPVPSEYNPCDSGTSTVTVTFCPWEVNPTPTKDTAEVTITQTSGKTASSKDVTILWSKTGYFFPYTIDWGDGSPLLILKSKVAGGTESKHSYNKPGTYNISITNKSKENVTVTSGSKTVVVTESTTDYAKMMDLGKTAPDAGIANKIFTVLENTTSFSFTSDYSGSSGASFTGLVPYILLSGSSAALTGSSATQQDTSGMTMASVLSANSESSLIFYIANPTTSPVITQGSIATRDAYRIAVSAGENGTLTATVTLVQSSDAHSNGWEDLTNAFAAGLKMYLRSAWLNSASGKYVYNDFYVDYNSADAGIQAFSISVKGGKDELPAPTKGSDNYISALNIGSGIVDYGSGSSALTSIKAYSSGDVGNGIVAILPSVVRAFDVGTLTSETEAEIDQSGYLNDPRKVYNVSFNFKPSDIFDSIGEARILLTANGFFLLKSSSPSTDQPLTDSAIEVIITGLAGNGVFHYSHDTSSGDNLQALAGGYASKAEAAAAAVDSSNASSNAYKYGTYYYDAATSSYYIYVKMFGGVAVQSGGSSGSGGSCELSSTDTKASLIPLLLALIALGVLSCKLRSVKNT